MFNQPYSIILILIALLWLFFSFATCRHIYHSGRKNAAWLIGGIRMLILLLLGALLYTVFFSFEEKSSKPEKDISQRRVLVLQDHSASMDFSYNKESRAANANKVWERIQKKSAVHSSKPELLHFYYADNLVSEKSKDNLRRDATHTAKALANVLTRTRMDAVVIISDGAHTDGQPPVSLMGWARNRNLPIYGIGFKSQKQRFFDLAAGRSKCREINPDYIDVQIIATGEIPGPARIHLSIDHKRIETKELRIANTQLLRFRLPDTEKGWHEYAIEIDPIDGELTSKNNLQRGIFKTVPPAHILLVYKQPKLDYRFIIRTMKKMYAEQVKVSSLADAKLKNYDPDDFMLLILADIKPDDLPLPILNAIKSKNLNTLFLDSSGWTSYLKDYPVHSIIEAKNLYLENKRAANLKISQSLNEVIFRGLDFSSLSMNHFKHVRQRPGAQTIFYLESGDQSYPLLLTDKIENPSYTVLTTDTSWKWALHPEPNIRMEYEVFWRTISNWLIGDTANAQNLDLQFGNSVIKNNHTRISLTHKTAELTESLKNPRLQLWYPEYEKAFTFEKTGQDWQLQWPNPGQRPLVIWGQAEAESGLKSLTTEKKPFLLPVRSQELLKTSAQPEKLQSYVTDPKTHFVSVENADSLIDNMLDSLKLPEIHYRANRRDSSRELIFALLIILLSAADWFIEKRLRESH